jgi:GNAT superfamily N-acetyltransferase
LKVRAWQAAYGGLLGEELLAALDPAEETVDWRDYLLAKPAEDRLWLALDGPDVVGFARTGPSPDADLPRRTAELFGLYVEPSRIGTGLGRALLRHVLLDLRARRFHALALWHFAGNALAAAFYEREGLPADGARRGSAYGVDEVRRLCALA